MVNKLNLAYSKYTKFIYSRQHKHESCLTYYIFYQPLYKNNNVRLWICLEIKWRYKLIYKLINIIKYCILHFKKLKLHVHCSFFISFSSCNNAWSNSVTKTYFALTASLKEFAFSRSSFISLNVSLRTAFLEIDWQTDWQTDKNKL